MTQDEIIAVLTPWEAQYHAIREAYRPLADALNLSPGNPFADALWSTFTCYTEALARQVGDTGEWLSWFCWENGMGKSCMKAGPTDAMRPICSLADLAWLIAGEAA